MARRKPIDSPGMVRRSVSLPVEECTELERIAGEKKVSVSWVVRDAVSQYLASRQPLFNQNVLEGTRQR